MRLNINQKVGLLLSPDGDLHVYLDGRHIMKAASGLPVDQLLWGLVNVYANCSKIKPELLNVEWDNGVVVDLLVVPFAVHPRSNSHMQAICMFRLCFVVRANHSVLYSHNSEYTSVRCNQGANKHS